MSNPSENRAVLRGAVPPSRENRQRFLDFLEQTYHRPFTLEWEQDDTLQGGFLLQAGTDIYDWSTQGAAAAISGAAGPAASQRMGCDPPGPGDLVRLGAAGTAGGDRLCADGGDGIATVSGLEHAAYGEILLFDSGVKGMVQDLAEGELGCILFGDDEQIVQGSRVRRSRKVAGVPVGDAFLGRVVNALGVPIDGKGGIRADGYRPLEAAGSRDHRPPACP